jgi:hypothetical protein
LEFGRVSSGEAIKASVIWQPTFNQQPLTYCTDKVERAGNDHRAAATRRGIKR